MLLWEFSSVLIIRPTRVEIKHQPRRGFTCCIASFKPADTDKGLFSTSPGSASLKKLSTIKLNTRQKAVDSLVILDKALDRINLERAKLGAIMSRMTKAIDNLSNVSMNTKESRGRITDADFALESANLTKAQILQQSATAMIAQASKSMQTVLELLR